MSSLSFADRQFLILYRRFYGKRYPGDISVPPHADNMSSMTPSHIRGEKMGYILKLIQLSIGGYNYTWNYHGPYSPGLLAQLRELDEKKEEIKNFYDENLPDNVVFTDDNNSQSLFWADDRQRIDDLLARLDLPKDEQAAGEKMELLGSIAYISLNVLPGASFERIVAELMARKSKYAKVEMLPQIKNAWKTLQDLELVGACSCRVI